MPQGAFALPDILERENLLQMSDQRVACLKAVKHYERRIGKANCDFEGAFCGCSFSLFHNRDLYAGQLE
jgi:hypothetical protein